MWGLWNHPYLIKSKKAQALLELSIFGAILIMLLGILVNYGLRYYSEQRVMQEAFRKELQEAAASSQPGTATGTTYVVVQDSHIPNPSDPWAVGSVIPAASSASVIRNWHLQDTADTLPELPVVKINIQGQEYGPYQTAGFRDEKNVPVGAVEKYKEIYGSNNVWTIGAGECLEQEEIVNPQTGQVEIRCLKPTENIKIIDSYEGQIFSYDSAVRQCRQIVDVEACLTECSRWSGSDCASTCSQEMNPPNQNDAQYYPDRGGAWYCANYQELDPVNHRYNFPVLNQLFIQTAGRNALGLQSDYMKTTTTSGNTLIREETASGITASDTINWTDQTNRVIIYKPYGDSSGRTDKEEVSSVFSQSDKTINW